MAKRQIFERKNDKLSEYLSQLEELLKKNRGSGTYEAYNVNPNAYKLSEDKVVDPSGLGQDVMNDNLKYAAYEPTSIAMTSPNTQLDPNALNFDTSSLEQQYQVNDINFSTPTGFKQIIDELTSVPVNWTSDGGLLYSNGIVRYDNGTSRQATQADVPKVVARFSNGSVLLDNGLYLDPNASVGRAYSGLSGLIELVFGGRDQKVTQEYGNYNPSIEPGKGYNTGTDIETKNLPEDFYFTFPFETKVVGITYDDGTRWGDKSGHQGYGNSVVLELPNGSKIRLAHLSDMENFQVGNIVQPFDYVGTPGQTGNTYGEHLDLTYYDPQGNKIDDPQNFWLDASDYVDTDKINQALESGKDTLKPEEKQWLDDQQNLMKNDIQANPMYALGNARPDISGTQPIEQMQPQLPKLTQNGLINQPGETIVPQRPVSQAIGKTVNEAGNYLANKGIGTNIGNSPEGFLGAGELLAGNPAAAGRELSATIERVKPTGDSIDFGGSELLRGDIQGAKQNFSNTMGRIGARLGRLPGEIGKTIVPQVQADQPGTTKPETLAQNIAGATQSASDYFNNRLPGDIKDIGSSLKNTASNAVVQAGEGLNSLKNKVSNLFQKTPLMGLFQGQQQVGNAKGSTLIETGGQSSGTPQADAFFKYGGADQYAQYLIDNAEQAKGGALDTSLFKNEFFQDPNNIANVFGSTSQGSKATQLYKDYLNSQIKEGYNEPYRTELRQEGDTVYEYKIPVTEYWQNQYYKQLLGETPDVLKSDFSYDKFQLPTVNKSASSYKGDVPVKSASSPIFSSAAVDLFNRTGSKVGKLAGDILKTPAAVYQSSTPSTSYEIPQASKSIFTTPASFSSASMPSVQKSVYKAPTLADYLAKGKTSAQYYAETGQQSTLDAINKYAGTALPSQINEYGYRVQNVPAGSSPAYEQLLRLEEDPKTASSGPIGSTSNWNDAGKSASLSNSAQASIKSGSTVKDWLQNLFKKIF